MVVQADQQGYMGLDSSTSTIYSPHGQRLIGCSALFGLVYMLPILFTLGDLETILASVTGQPLPEMFLQATGNRGAAFGLFFIGELAGITRSPFHGLRLTHSARERSSMWASLLSSCIPMYLGVSLPLASSKAFRLQYLLMIQLFQGRGSAGPPVAWSCLTAS